MAENPIFVGRDPELATLRGFYEKALAGHGQICFLSGEAGAGKSTLVGEFVRQAQADNDDLAVAFGSCDSQTGSGDPYLPFREIFEQLTGSPDEAPAQPAEAKLGMQENSRRLKKLAVLTGDLLINMGPDLIDLFLPGGKLIMLAGKLALNKTNWSDKTIKKLEGKPEAGKPAKEGLDQGQIFEQYINILKALTKKAPLVLVLEDLHWADADSLGLLFRAGRQLEGMRLLIIGTFRPNDIAMGRDGQRHPLEQVLSEMKRYFGEIEVDLDRARAERGREFVGAYLDTEFNCLDESFREALFRHTGGHPLFTVELVRHMQETGHLEQDERNCWREGPGLDWDDLPSRVEGIFEERVGRLSNELRERLTVGSVEGDQFTAEVIARVKSVDVRTLVGQLSGELVKEHHLIESAGVERVGLQRLSHYNFSHYLLQAFLYKKLDTVELSYLHEDVGLALEELYGDGADGIAVQLAHHFGLAGEDEKARHYLQRAAEMAAAGHANRQAADYFTRALALSPKGDLEARYLLLLGREQVYDLLGERVLQANDLDELERLANTAGKPDKLAEVNLRRSQWAINRSDYTAAMGAAEKSVECARTSGDRGREAAAHRLWGSALREKGDYEAAKAQFELGRDLALLAQVDLVWARCLHELGAIAYFKSNYEEARTSWEQILEMYRQKDDRRGQALALRSLGIVANQVGDFTAAHKATSEALELARTVGDRQEESRCLTTLANTARHEGDLTGAQRFYEQALGMYQQLGNRAWEGLGLMNLGYVIWEQGNFKKAMGLLEQAFVIQEETGNRWAQASCLENLGMAARDMGKPDQARVFFQRALEICHELGLRDDEVSVLIESGIAADDLGEWDAAREAFEKALKIAEGLGQMQAKTEALAGLAQAALRAGDLPGAVERVNEIVTYLEKDPGMVGSQRPMRVHLICFKVFKAAQDERATDFLSRAHAQLQERAAKIAEDDVRQLFLEAIATHRELIQEFNQLARKGNDHVSG